MLSLSHFDPETFLRDYWQKKPLVIRQGLVDFVDPLDGDELAGLAMEEGIDARIVSLQNGQWQVAHGPFDDINQHCVGDWSLLVQGVDQYSPDGDTLMRAFEFIPHWRMTDLMVSFSSPGAGVGAHIDQYDVFIVQGQGSRRWQVGLPGDHQRLTPHPDLQQISAFDAVIDEVLQPGDIIYIPPHHPHNGVAEQFCLNYSIGFRAPSEQELLGSYSDYVLEHNLMRERYKDEQLSARRYAGEITDSEVERFRQMMSQTLASEHFEHWLVGFLSRTHRWDDDQHETVNPEQISQLLENGHRFIRAPGIKPLYRQIQHTQQDFEFYIEGQRFTTPKADSEWMKVFLDSPMFALDDQSFIATRPFFADLLGVLVNAGFWYVE